MSKLKRKKAYAEKTLTSFGGLRDDADACGVGAISIRNFCFRPDGALEKRPGYILEKEFTQPVRAVWESAKSNFAGKFYLAGNEIVYENRFGVRTGYGYTESATGAANFFVYRGYLYLADSSCIYFCDLPHERFLPVYGYAPLFGTQWNPTSGSGSLNEPINLLSPRIRVTYDCSAGARQIRLPFPAESVDGVRASGRTLAYSFTSGERILYLTSATAEAEVEVAMTLGASYSPLRSSILSCSIAYGFQKADCECLYLGGGIDGFRAFSAADVSDGMLSLCKNFYPDADPLYIKSSGSLVLGDPDHPLTAFARHNNRVIAFGSSGAWSLQRAEGSDSVEFYYLDSCPGCVAREAAIPVGEEIFVMTSAGLALLKADASDKDHFSIIPLCLNLSKRLANFNKTRALLLYDAGKNRILLRDAGETEDGLVYLYDRDLQLWTLWDHVAASRFYAIDQRILFSQGSKLFCFDDSTRLDNGNSFEASYQSGAISFDSPEEYKRALRFFCEAGAANQELTLEVQTESRLAELFCTCPGGSFPTHHELRVPCARYRFFSYRIAFSGSGPAILYRVGFCCNL